jgi:O-antigen/teichoic acid export membrane protein
VTSAPPTPRADHRGQLEKLARRGTASVVGAGCSAVSGVLFVVVVTNGFSPTVAGTLFAATSAFLILESVAFLGTETGLVRCLPAQLASGRAADVRRTLVVAAVPVVVLSVVVAVAVFASAGTMAPHLVGTGAAGTMTEVLRILAVVLPVAAMHAVVLAATRGMGSMRPTVVVENVGRFGLQALGVLGVQLAGGGPRELALAWALPYLLGLAVASGWLNALVAAKASGAGRPAPWLQLARAFWSYTALRAVARVMQTALKRSDIVLVAALASPAEAALYTAATRFIVLGQLFVQSVQQALSPHLSSLFARDDKEAALSVYRAATLWSMIVAWPLYLVLAGFSPTLMAVFGEGYDVASDVVLILALTMLLATACGPVDSVLLMAGRSWLSLRNSTVALAVNVGLNVLLIPAWGIRGAAISWAVAIVVRNLLPLLIVGRQLAMWPVTRATVQVAVVAVACFGSVVAVTGMTDLPVGLDLAALAVAAAGYAAVIWKRRRPLGLEAFAGAVRRRRPESETIESEDEERRVST